MNLTDEEIIELRNQGAKLTVHVQPKPKADAPKLSDAQIIAAELSKLQAAILALANREEPDVNVGAPAVTVKPQINVESPKAPRKWRFEVVERDRTADHAIKVFTAEAIG